MKILLLLPVLAILGLSSSCRTSTPLDPHTMKPTSRCLPENMGSSGTVEATK